MKPVSNPAQYAREGPPLESMPERFRLDHHAAAKGKVASESTWFNRLLVTLMPLAPKALVQPFAKRYVAGETPESMLEAARQLNEAGCPVIVNLLGEFIHSIPQAEKTAETYRALLFRLNEHEIEGNISIKPSSLGLLLDPLMCEQLYRDVLDEAKQMNRFVRVEMEDTSSTSAIIDLFLKLRQDYDNVGLVVQAYLRRTHEDVLRILDAGGDNFRLCKGIYIEPRWLAYKLPDLVNKNYVAVLEEMFKRGAYVGIATHDERLVWEALKLIRKYNLSTDQYEFQMLMGVDPELREMLVAAGHTVRVYVPYGEDWYAYSLRRFKENPKIAGYILQNLFKK